MQMRLRSAFVAAALAVTAACGGAGGGGGGNQGFSQLPELVKVAVGIDASYACFFVGDQEGVFRKYGLNVSIDQFEQGGVGQDAMIAGQEQMSGSGDATTITKASKNPDLRIVSIYETSGKYVKVVGRKGVDSVAQMKKIGVVKASISEYAASQMLAFNNIKEADVKFVPASPADLPALLQRGDIDGTVIWEPWPTKATELGGHVISDTDAFKYSYQQVLNVKQGWLSGHEEYAKRFNQALAESCRKVSADQKGTVAAVSKSTHGNIDEASTKGAIRDIDFTVRAPNSTDLANYSKIIDWQLGRGIISTKPDLSTVVTTKYVSNK
jgi:NitT/TauT family transport system substrate-binding protein